MLGLAHMEKPPNPFNGIKGVPLGWKPNCEGDHFAYCKSCRQWFDVRDFGLVMHHERSPHKPFANDA